MWDNFLKSLETEGGKMLVTVFMLLFLAGVSITLVLSGHPPQEIGRDMLLSSISAFLGILYGYLKAGSK